MTHEEYGPSSFGDRVASIYDEWFPRAGDASPAVDFLARLAAGGRALELGIGTGRIALPLAHRGVDVWGIDASPAMLEVLRDKDEAAQVKATLGDFADLPVDGCFSLIYAAFATFFMLPSQEVQLRCLRNVAEHLSEGGWFALDAFVPDPTRYRNQGSIEVRAVEADQVSFEVATHDPVGQSVRSAQVTITEAGIAIYPAFLRYAWPAELDAMALAAGLEPVSRFGGYDRRPFTSRSSHHVSLYRKAGA